MSTASNLVPSLPSTGWAQKLRPSLEAFVGPNHPLMALLDINCPGPHAAHRVYTLGLRDIVDGKRVDDSLNHTSWRFLAGGHKNVSTAGSFQTTPDLSKVTGVLESPEIAGILNNIQQLNDLPQVKEPFNNMYELRVLRIPGIYIEAFWLKCMKGPPGDWLVPYGVFLHADGTHLKLPGGLKLTRMGPIPADILLDKIQPLAKKLLAFHNPPKAPG